MEQVGTKKKKQKGQIGHLKKSRERTEMKNSKISAAESNAEALRLHALMKQRNEDAVREVEEMSKHPYSREQKIKQAEEMERRAFLSGGANTSKP